MKTRRNKWTNDQFGGGNGQSEGAAAWRHGDAARYPATPLSSAEREREPHSSNPLRSSVSLPVPMDAA